MDGLDLSKIPAAVPPPGIIPNFIDPPSLEEFPKIVTYITLPLMVFFLGLRIYARVRLASVGVDDCKSKGLSNFAPIEYKIEMLTIPLIRLMYFISC